MTVLRGVLISCQVCDAVIVYKDHKSMIVQRTARDLMPTLARVSPAGLTKTAISHVSYHSPLAFVSYTINGSPYVTLVLTHLLKIVRKDKDRPMAFQSLGTVEPFPAISLNHKYSSSGLSDQGQCLIAR